MKNMAFSITTKQMYAGTKDVTRRLGWLGIRPGVRVMAVEKGIGLKVGEKVKQIGEIKIVSARLEPLNHISVADVVREGFPELSIREFIIMFCKSHKCEPDQLVTRIEFERLYPVGDTPISL